MRKVIFLIALFVSMMGLVGCVDDKKENGETTTQEIDESTHVTDDTTGATATQDND